MHKNKWTKTSWQSFPILQQPNWPDSKKLSIVIEQLERLPSLVFSGETRRMINSLKSVNNRESFILHIGNCAESFSDCHGPKIHNFLRIFLQMSMIINYKSKKNIIKIGRIAGQYAKPRSSDYEDYEGKKILAYRGDNVNDHEPSNQSRIPNPERLTEGYFKSAATLNLIRAFFQGGYNDIYNLNDWGKHCFKKEINQLKAFKEFEAEISSSIEAISGSKEYGFDNNIYTSHEALLLNYEEAFTRQDTTFGGYYDTSAHFLWIGERTRQLNGAHVEFMRGIGNPIGIKIGPNYNLEEIVNIINTLNPANSEGRLVLITRMGYKKIQTNLSPLIETVRKNKLNVIWMCDPMHGNTITEKGYKVRHFDHIVSELITFFNICFDMGVLPGGVHLEVTDENVTECIGGIVDISAADLHRNYATKVDPRLNAAQALELALIVGDLLKS